MDIIYQNLHLYAEVCYVRSRDSTNHFYWTPLSIIWLFAGFSSGMHWKKIGRNKEKKSDHFPIGTEVKVTPPKKKLPFFFPLLGAILSCLLRVCMTLPFSEIWPPAPRSPSKELQDSNHQSSFLQFPIPKSSSFFQHLLSLEYSMFSFFSYSFLRLVEQIPHIK